MKKILFIFMFGIFCFSFINSINVVSASNLGVFEKDTCITLYQLCESCTFVNLTSIKIPGLRESDSMEIVIMNVNMTNYGKDFTYEYCNTSRVGNYQYNVCGDKGGALTCENIDFTVTKSGEILSEGDSRIYFITLFSVFIIFALTLVAGIAIPWPDERSSESGKLISINRFRSVKIMFLTMAYYQFYFIIHILVQISDLFLNLNLTFDFLRIMHTIYSATLWPFAALFVGFFTINLVFDYKKQNFLSKGGRK